MSKATSVAIHSFNISACISLSIGDSVDTVNFNFCKTSVCYCCCKLDRCVEALTSDVVLQDLAQDEKLTCITQHPSFNPVCLQKWSLRLASDKYSMKEKKKVWKDRNRGKVSSSSSHIVDMIMTRCKHSQFIFISVRTHCRLARNLF